VPDSPLVGKAFYEKTYFSQENLPFFGNCLFVWSFNWRSPFGDAFWRFDPTPKPFVLKDLERPPVWRSVKSYFDLFRAPILVVFSVFKQT
jgi:hypothetical protein